ncbi:MAG: nucleotide exchange factor GrpE [Clostridiales bacterium 41_12_two_minus]|nr:MAG: nucleotide exchange factor GrpE [Clostridiales bacterium 41_12_two_minus]
MTDMEKETVTDEILEETEQETAEDMSQEQTDAQAAENQPDDKDVQTDDKKRFFGKKKDKKDKQIEDLTAQLDDLRKRNLAEFENFRKRTEKEKSTMFDMGAKSVLEKLLPIIDNFERGFAGLSEEQMSDPFVSGMDMVYKQLVKALADMGVEPIEAVGKPFDPNLHNAVMHVEDENLGENTVAQEFQKGYLYHGSVVRHSMVQVAN